MKLLSAKYVVPLTSPVIEGGGILIDGGTIREVGPATELRRELGASDSIEDLGNAAILPGLINAHTHLELTRFHQALPRAGLWEWFEELLPRLVAPESDRILKSAIAEGAALSLAAGVTTVADISRRGLTAEAIHDSAIRRVCFVELISGASQPPSDPDELESIACRLARPTDRGLTTPGLSPHAPYTVVPNDIRATIDLANRQSWKLTMHLLETPEERDWLDGRTGYLADYLRDRGFACADHQPQSVEQYLTTSGLLNCRPLLAHVNYARDSTIALLAPDTTQRRGASVAFCPRAHDYFGHEDHPWRRLMKRGINVCLGTDSLASNESLSILDEMRFLGSRHAEVASQLLLEMGTLNAARALDMTRRIGHLSRDAFADCFAIATDTKQADDVIDETVRGSATPFRTWVAGEVASRQLDR